MLFTSFSYLVMSPFQDSPSWYFWDMNRSPLSSLTFFWTSEFLVFFPFWIGFLFRYPIFSPFFFLNIRSDSVSGFDFSAFSFFNNPLLSNELVLFHPPILFLLVSLSPLLFENKTRWTLFFIGISSFLFTGGWWAWQEFTWGGWWNWDTSELLGVPIFLLLLLLIHMRGILIKREVFLSFLASVVVFSSVQQNFKNSSHNFGMRLWAPPSLSFIFLEYLILLVLILSYVGNFKKGKRGREEMKSSHPASLFFLWSILTILSGPYLKDAYLWLPPWVLVFYFLWSQISPSKFFLPENGLPLLNWKHLFVFISCVFLFEEIWTFNFENILKWDLGASLDWRGNDGSNLFIPPVLISVLIFLILSNLSFK